MSYVLGSYLIDLLEVGELEVSCLLQPLDVVHRHPDREPEGLEQAEVALHVVLHAQGLEDLLHVPV